MGVITRTAALAARHLSEDTGQYTRRGPGARCRTHNAGFGAAAAGTVTDFRFEVPGAVHRIAVSDLPAPFATSSAGNAPSIIARPADAWPKAPNGFKVKLYSDGLASPRVIHVAPNRDVFVAESGGGRIRAPKSRS
jgi:glucose/arabinose dehydrogenase